MAEYLYDIFQKAWVKPGGTVWIYTDPHFSDFDCYKHFRFPEKFVDGQSAEIISATIKELDEMQIKRINSKCGKNDTLIILGDICGLECVKKLRAAYKILITGNHDKGASNYKRIITKIHETHCINFENQDIYKHIGEYWVADNRLFDEVYTGKLTISDKITLSHEESKEEFALNIHGHNHSGTKGYYELDGFKYFNACPEGNDYYPYQLNQIIKSGYLHNIQSIHRETIDNAIERKQRKQKRAE